MSKSSYKPRVAFVQFNLLTLEMKPVHHYGEAWPEPKKDARWFGMNKSKNNRVNRRKY